MRIVLAFLVLVMCSCGTPENLRVRQFHLQDTEATVGHPFIRAEMNKRLYGAVSLEERILRKGNYYHVRWAGLGGKALVKVVFEYRQARTGSKVNKRVMTAKASRKGEMEIVVGGREYLRDGHVQSWRVSLFEGERLVATEKSYLWE